MTAQIAEVKNTLGSVHQMARAGNRVQFESGNCYIEHIASGRRTLVIENNGTYEVGMWVPKSVRKDGVQQVSPNKPKSESMAEHSTASARQGAQQDSDQDTSF